MKLARGIPSHLVQETPLAVIPAAHRGLLVLAIVVITLVYMMPLSSAWMVSVVENYGSIADDMEVNARDGSASRRLAIIGLGVLGLIGILLPAGRKLQVRSPLALLAASYIAWSAASIVWAVEPRTSFVRLLSFGLEALAAIAIAKHFSPRQFVFLVWATTLAWMSLGFLAELSHNSFSPWVDSYRFSGLFHPNTMGAGCAIVMLASLYLAWSTGRHRTLLLSVAAAALVLTVLTGSRSALGGAILAGGLVWIGSASPRKVVGGSIAACVVGGVLISIAGGELFKVAGDAAMMGRSDRDQDLGSLTGRVPLWNELMVSVAERPIAGFGYNSYWTSNRIAEMSQREWGDIPNGHSLYIDTVLSGGVIGAVLFFGTMLAAIGLAIAAERRQPKCGYGFLAITVLYCLMNGIAETTMGISWFLQLFTITAVSYMAFVPRAWEPAAVAPTTDDAYEPSHYLGIVTASPYPPSPGIVFRDHPI